jgi:energy-coupling factor transport system permease protein
MEIIEVVSNAMELRCFGKESKRTWYQEREFSKYDYMAILFGFALILISFVLQYVNHGRYWNPFI